MPAQDEQPSILLLILIPVPISMLTELLSQHGFGLIEDQANTRTGIDEAKRGFDLIAACLMGRNHEHGLPHHACENCWFAAGQARQSVENDEAVRIAPRHLRYHIAHLAAG